LQQIARVANDVRAGHYDVAVDLQGALRSALLARWSGARVMYGVAEARESPASLWYTRNVIARGVHIVEQNMSIVEAVVQSHHVGEETTQRVHVPRVELPRHPESEVRVAQQLAGYNIKDFAILNPGAGWGAKRWPAERYGQVARALAGGGVATILNYGPGEESLAQSAAVASEGAAQPMKLTISELIALTRRARIFIGGDTGPLHLAAAVNVPVVAIFGPTDPARNGPYATDGSARGIVLRNPASSTTHKRHTQTDEGMLEITVDAVTNAAYTLLRTVTTHG
jgi:heptosyltransferase-1